MLRLPTTAALAILIAGPAVAADAHRELGAHQHGHATLNIAFEGNTISMELEAPGMDIVGFEHAASSEAERAAEAKAKALLTDPTQLFRLPAAAGCSLGSGKVVVESGHDHDRAADKKDAAPAAAGHTEFHAEYSFDCKALASVAGIEFPFFDKFPTTREIDVTVIGPKGQTKFEVSRDKPRIALGGIM